MQHGVALVLDGHPFFPFLEGAGGHAGEIPDNGGIRIGKVHAVFHQAVFNPADAGRIHREIQAVHGHGVVVGAELAVSDDKIVPLPQMDGIVDALHMQVLQENVIEIANLDAETFFGITEHLGIADGQFFYPQESQFATQAHNRRIFQVAALSVALQQETLDGNVLVDAPVEGAGIHQQRLRILPFRRYLTTDNHPLGKRELGIRLDQQRPAYPVHSRTGDNYPPALVQTLLKCRLVCLGRIFRQKAKYGSVSSASTRKSDKQQR